MLPVFSVLKSHNLESQHRSHTTLSLTHTHTHHYRKQVWGLLARLLLIPGGGIPPIGHISYPMIPWLGLTLFGMAAGLEYSDAPEQAQKRTPIFAATALVIFILIRSLGGAVGNLRGWPRGDGINISQSTVNQTTGVVIGVHNITVPAVIEFFNVCKYPPSVAFAAMTLAANLLGLTVFQKMQQYVTPRTRTTGAASSSSFSFSSSEPMLHVATADSYQQPLVQPREAYARKQEEGRAGAKMTCCRRFFTPCPAKKQGVLLMPPLVFGRTPLFFYILHFNIWGALGVLVFSNGLPLRQIVPVWMAVLCLLYPLCDAYGHFKGRTGPNSLWRFL